MLLKDIISDRVCCMQRVIAIVVFSIVKKGFLSNLGFWIVSLIVDIQAKSG